MDIKLIRRIYAFKHNKKASFISLNKTELDTILLDAEDAWVNLNFKGCDDMVELIHHITALESMISDLSDELKELVDVIKKREDEIKCMGGSEKFGDKSHYMIKQRRSALAGRVTKLLKKGVGRK